eukprot:1980329-Prymnesium_polylepis.1
MPSTSSPPAATSALAESKCSGAPARCGRQCAHHSAVDASDAAGSREAAIAATWRTTAPMRVERCIRSLERSLGARGSTNEKNDVSG